MAAYKDRKTGKWYAAYYVRRKDGTLRKTFKRGFRTKADALAWEMQHKHEAASGESNSFGEMFEEASRSNNANETTIQTRRNRLVKYAPDLYRKPIRKITKAQLQQWAAQLKDSGLAPSTINDTIGYVKQVFHYAAVTYDIPDNSLILKPVSLHQRTEAPQQMHIITPDDFNRILEAETDPRCRDFFTFLYLTGCRKGEARALLKSDFQTREGQAVVYIHQSMRRYADSLKLPKTAGSVRYVPLDDTSAAICRRLADRKGVYLFGDYKPLVLTMLQDHFKADLKAAGLPEDIRIHDLRHSHVSLLWANGVPVPEISHRIGHSSPAVTMRTYSHIFDNKQESSLAVLNRLKLNDLE